MKPSASLGAHCRCVPRKKVTHATEVQASARERADEGINVARAAGSSRERGRVGGSRTEDGLDEATAPHAQVKELNGMFIPFFLLPPSS